MSKRLVLFDFDGTLTQKDTLFQFIRYYHGAIIFLAGLAVLSPVLVFLKLGLLDNGKAKEIVLRFFFKDTPLEIFNSRCSDFAQKRIPALIRPSAMLRLSNALKDQSKVVVVSASPENWVMPWCNSLNIQCIATRLQVVDQRISGKINGKNCHGKEKVTRIKEVLSLDDFDQIIAYGDSKGDREMLQLAHQVHYQSL